LFQKLQGLTVKKGKAKDRRTVVDRVIDNVLGEFGIDRDMISDHVERMKDELLGKANVFNFMEEEV
jgi:hypothetical protein